jgi:hypothetical protein
MHQYIPSGSDFELSIRAASILAVEALKEAVHRIQSEEEVGQEKEEARDEKKHPNMHLNSVLLDFWLWDLAGDTTMELPHHRTRSIWY